ncbi:MAG TPA: tetratricopeptide repeat protein [Thermoplasmata archaeon]|nr:tetratricopeptide repeat protein [Thermoplasmata archaeon]
MKRLLRKGSSAEEQLRFQEAREHYAEALRLEPSSPWCLSAMAGLLVRIGDYQEAILLNRRILSLDPTDHSRWHGLGNLLFAFARRPSESVDAYRRAVELDPSNPAYHAGLVQALSVSGVHDEAIDHGRRMVADPTIRFVRESHDRAALFEVYGNALLRAGKAKDAVEAYRRAIEIEPSDDHRYALVRGLSAAGMHEEAIGLIEKLLQGGPEVVAVGNRAILYAHYGDVLRRAGRRKDAVDAYRRALDLAPREPEARSRAEKGLKELGETNG